jgi:hypothetical protein
MPGQGNDLRHLIRAASICYPIWFNVFTFITGKSSKDLPGYKIYWRQRGQQFNGSFREFVTDLNARPADVSAEIYQPGKEGAQQ